MEEYMRKTIRFALLVGASFASLAFASTALAAFSPKLIVSSATPQAAGGGGAVRIGALAESSAVAARVGAVRRIVVASPDYVARHGTPRAPADLEAHAVVAFSGIAGVELIFRNEAGEGSVSIKPRLVVTTAEAALDAVRAGFGITRVLSYQAADDIARGSLLRLLSAYEGEDLPIHLLYPGGRHPPPKLRAFVDFARPRLRRRCEAVLRAVRS